jgi:RimJ/RimL family protein N-acetyltransferase
MIIGKNIDLRPVEVRDAEFILSLRLDPELNKYISAVENDIDKQKKWIKLCIEDKNQWYFIVQNKKVEPVGTIRIYDIKGDSFCWGSWIIKPEARSYASLESAVLLYKYAFLELGFNKSHFDVRRENKKAINIYLRFGAIVVEENDLDLFMILERKSFTDKISEYDALIEAMYQRNKLS